MIFRGMLEGDIGRGTVRDSGYWLLRRRYISLQHPEIDHLSHGIDKNAERRKGHMQKGLLSGYYKHEWSSVSTASWGCIASPSQSRSGQPGVQDTTYLANSFFSSIAWVHGGDRLRWCCKICIIMIGYGVRPSSRYQVSPERADADSSQSRQCAGTRRLSKMVVAFHYQHLHPSPYCRTAQQPVPTKSYFREPAILGRTG